jgi:hypothetical protein
MPRVLEETTALSIDREHVVRRVDDWVDRINALYDLISSWLPHGWTTDRTSTVRMHEELMRQHDVPARDLPVLRLTCGARTALIEPRGLWIIGANGRLDLFTDSRHYIIVDAAENLWPPQWEIAPFSARQQTKPLDAKALLAAL